MPAPEDLLADRYRLVQRVGAGATGEVWRARDERLAREVAIKIVDLSAQHDAPGAVARFRRETNTSAALSSPYVVAVYDAGSDGDLAFIVMELLNGPSLKDLVERDGPLEFASGLLIAAQAARGLADAHALGIVHRDLKPGNIVLSGGVPKIVDFGIARLADPGDATQTSTATVAGTAAYMSPEQATGQRVTTASDLYSFGCLLMAIFSGASPFPGRGPIEQATAQVHELPPMLDERRPDAPQALTVLVSRLLAKDPSQRPDAATTASELQAIRTALLRGEQPTRPIPPVTALAPASSLGAAPQWPTSQATPRSQTTPSDAPAGPLVAAAVPVRRRGSALPWIATLLVACATAFVGWLNLDRAEPLAPPATPTVTITTTATPLSTPTLRLPSVSTQPSSSRKAKAKAKAGATADPTPTPTSEDRQPEAADEQDPTQAPEAEPSASATPTPEPTESTSAEPAPAPTQSPTKATR